MTDEPEHLVRDIREALEGLPSQLAAALFDVANDLRRLDVRPDVVEAFYLAAIHHGENDSYLNLGNLYAENDDHAKALEAYRASWRHGDAKGAFMAAQALESEGSLEEARDAYTFAAVQFPEASYRLARVLDAMGEHERAAEVLEGSAESSWESAVDLALGASKPVEEAIALLERHRDRGESEVAVTLGLLYERAGRDADARETWRRAAETGDAFAATNLGLALDDDGDRTEAVTWWRFAAQRGDEKAAELLEDLATTD
ncbi:hypothetical protein GCM10009718_15490 [Isoptericola halotolerans]|uniref:Tetratricopeptide (TPR) repeat protein n=1 Tax=Isoptericola halotolerans TaxID=300560 RepID=A0ABX1ZY40_9MICO|nr:tetratricopeptide repeat protein [Isoptericola halotolerans]NOV95530.1 tetratricopeptide (TPR) repeat protein [Isoptericola halotolerans]